MENVLLLTGNGGVPDKNLIISTDVKKKLFEIGCILLFV